MATIFALILLPAIFCLAFLGLTVGTGAGLGAYLGIACFGALLGGMVLGLFRLTAQWEDEPV